MKGYLRKGKIISNGLRKWEIIGIWYCGDVVGYSILEDDNTRHDFISKDRIHSAIDKEQIKIIA